MDRGTIETVEDRRVRLNSRGLKRTLADPHRPHLIRLAIQHALSRYRETLDPSKR